ncbi:MAG: Xaa-Pro peptidase family protein [Methanomicrobiales archaeon]|nr:Xaa-Pro peptidase family protein [Methanomicrobiales archaeon]
MDPLDRAMAEKNAKAYAAYGSGNCDADIRYLSGFRTSDAILYMKRYDESPFIVVSSMELERAAQEAKVRAMTRKEAGFFEYLSQEGDHRDRAMARTIASLGGAHIMVPPYFPFSIAKELSALCEVSIEDKEVVKACRARKDGDEIRSIKGAQEAAEEAMRVAVGMIARSKIRNGELSYDESPLTSERVKAAIHRSLVDRGCTGRDTIVSCGRDTAIPHHTGGGVLLADEPIVIDIFPQNEEGYYADMSRTVVRGEPSPEILEMYTAVKWAKSIAIGEIRAGKRGSDIHQMVVDYLSAQGFESDSQGFIHNLGHGVGLEVHEHPVLGPRGDELEPGNVITVEPGLYYKGVGGVRLEDMGIVRPNGFELLTLFEEECAV